MKIRIILLLVSFFIVSGLLHSQTDSTARKEMISAYEITEIPLKIEETLSIIASEKNSFLVGSTVPDAKEKLDLFLQEFNALKDQSNSLDFTKVSSVKINELFRQWESLQNTLSSSVETISKRSKELGEKKELFTKFSEIWKITREKAVKEKAPAELLKSIGTLQNELRKIDRQITDELNQLLSIQTNFSEKNLFIESELIKLKDLQIKSRRYIFKRNAPPVWLGFAEPNHRTLEEEISELYYEYADAITRFFQDSNRLALDFLLILFFLVLTFSIRHYSKKIRNDVEIEEDSAKLAFRILERPYSVAALLFLLFTALITEDTYNSIISLRKILVLIPLLRILLHIISAPAKKPLILIMFLFTLKELKVNVGSETLIERWLLLIISVVSILGVIWIKKSGVIQKIVSKSRIKYYIERGISILLVLFVIVLIANLFGYVMLGLFLINGIFDSIFITILLITSVYVVNGLFIISLETKPALKLKTVQLYSDRIKRVFNKIVVLFFSIAWAIFILDAFNIYVTVLDKIIFILTAKWGVGNFAISLGDILSFIITIWFSVQLSKFTRFILEVDILPQFRLPRGVPGAITSLAKYVIIGIGIFIAFLSAGLDLNKFTLLAGALGVGIGFGLQDLVSNFISGIILIFERPIQVGDVIVVGTLSGEVKKIGIRSSIIRTWQGSEIIIPNGHLISSEVTNWTFSDRKRRIEIVVGAAYGSDVELVKSLLLKCANENKELLTSPAPVALFKDLGESSLDFELRCWTTSGDWLEIASDLRYCIVKAFEENNVEIPFPQRDIHIKTNVGNVEGKGESKSD